MIKIHFKNYNNQKKIPNKDKYGFLMKLEEKINYLKEIDIKLNKNYIYNF